MNRAFLRPESIVVVGGSGDPHKPGGKLLKNLVDGGYEGRLFAVSPKGGSAFGVTCAKDIAELPNVDLAFVAVPAAAVTSVVERLATEKGTRAFVVISAGFSEAGPTGKKLEEDLLRVVESAGATLVGPNSIGVLTPRYHGVFTEPIPRLDPKGCALISGSGATAVFLLEMGKSRGLRFSSVFSVGNSAQVGVADVLGYLDESFDPATSSEVVLLYLEKVEEPQKLLDHARSLAQKGCRLAAIKAGTSEAGIRAAASHTGALATPDIAVDALFQKAGIVRCESREELIDVACVLQHPPLQGKNIAVITHAGGPGVMAADALSHGGLLLPKLPEQDALALREALFPGAATSNPIDILATGTAAQLALVLDHIEHRAPDIDGMVVIFGTPGLVPVFDVYDAILERKRTFKKPMFTVMPSEVVASREIARFEERGEIHFPDEVRCAQAVCKVAQTPRPDAGEGPLPSAKVKAIRAVIEGCGPGFLPPEKVMELLSSAGIDHVMSRVVRSREELLAAASHIGYPIVLKVIGPVHKSDAHGVSLDIHQETELLSEYERLFRIQGATGVLAQPMIDGTELFLGAKREPAFGFLVACGLGGIFVEGLGDVAWGLGRQTLPEARRMWQKLRGRALLRGARGRPAVDEEALARCLVALSELLIVAPEIEEIDINPLFAKGTALVAADARARLEPGPGSKGESEARQQKALDGRGAFEQR